MTIPTGGGGVSAGFERERSRKLALAGRLDDATATDLAEQSGASSSIDALASATERDGVASADATEAVRRMRFGEQVTEQLVAVVGPHTPDSQSEDQHNVARDMGRLVLDTAIDFVLGQLAIEDKIREKLGSAFGRSLGSATVGLRLRWGDFELDISKSVNVLDYLVDKAASKLRSGINSLFQLVLGDSNRAVERADEGSREVAQDAYARMASGTVATGAAVQRTIDGLLPSVVDGLTDAIRGFLEQVVVVDIGDPGATGDEVYGIDGSLNQLHGDLGPASVESGLDGTIRGARNVRDGATEAIRRTADGVAGTFDTIDTASREWNVADAILDVLQAGDGANWWTLTRNFAEAILGFVAKGLNLFKAGVGIGSLVGLALGHHTALERIASGGRSD